MYKEFDKYKTGNTCKGIGVITNQSNKEIGIIQDEYIAPLGDLLEDYIKHVQQPFWKKWTCDYKFRNKLYKDFLNHIKLHSQY